MSNRPGERKNYANRMSLSDIKQRPLRFDSVRGEEGYVIPKDVHLVTDECASGTPALAWLDPMLCEGGSTGAVAPPPDGCLQEFLKLGMGRDPGPDGTNKDVLRFARRRGVLAIWPCPVSICQEECAYQLREPVDHYTGLARRMRTLLELAQYIRDTWLGRPADSDVRSLLRHAGLVGGDVGPESVSHIMNQWLRWSGVHPALSASGEGEGGLAWRHDLRLPGFFPGFDWDRSGEIKRRLRPDAPLAPPRNYMPAGRLPREDQRPSPLFAILVMQTAEWLISPQGVRVCSVCGDMQPVARKARADRPSYTCGGAECKRVARNAYQNDTNRKKRALAQTAGRPS